MKISTDSDRCDRAELAEILLELAGKARGRARIGVLDNGGLTYWQIADPALTAPPVPLLPGSVPAHTSALGQLLLAYADEGIRQRVIERELGSPETAVQLDRDTVQTSLSVTRLSGVAIIRTRRSGRATGVAVAVPVHGVGGEVVAGIEVDVQDFDSAESVLVDLTAAAPRVGAACVRSA